MEYIFFGNNASLSDRLQTTLNSEIIACHTFAQIRQVLSNGDNANYCIFMERDDVNTDVMIIREMHKLYARVYIILLSSSLSKEDKIAYIKAGVNCVITDYITQEEFLRLLSTADDFLRKSKPQEEKVILADNLKPFKLPAWKRAFDIVSSLSAIICLSPILLFTTVAVAIESGWPVIYKSKRVGSNYKIFDFYKFRSMYKNADKKLTEYKIKNQYTVNEVEGVSQPSTSSATLQMIDDSSYYVSDNTLLFSDSSVTPEQDYLKIRQSTQANAFFKMENDPRITHIGHVIRKYSIDELPQLFNILKGDMSVVGNRPLPVYEAEQLTSDSYIERFMGPAGLTGLWQVEKRGSSGNLSAEERKQLDIRYAREFSFLLDIKVILKTFTAFIQKEDV